MLDRINFVTGSGHELRVGLRYETSEVTLGETQAEINPLFADIAYSVGLGHGLSGFTEVSADVENLADRFQIGLAYISMWRRACSLVSVMSANSPITAICTLLQLLVLPWRWIRFLDPVIGGGLHWPHPLS